MSDDPKPTETPAPEPAKEPTDLEKRLSSIVGVTNELRQNDNTRTAEISDLKSLVVGINQKLDSLGTPSPGNAPPATPPADPFALSAPSATPDPAASSSQDFQTAVNSAVQEALKPLVEQNTAQGEKLTKQRAVYAKVLERSPEFGDPTSEEYQLFNQIYNARPDLQVLADAPSIVSEIVRGITADKRQEQASVDLAKQRVSVPQTMGRDSPQGDPQKVREAFTALQAEGERRELTPKERGDYLNLATAVAHLDE